MDNDGIGYDIEEDDREFFGYMREKTGRPKRWEASAGV